MKNRTFINVLITLISMVSALHLNAQVPENNLVFDGNNDYVSVPSTAGDELNPEFNLTVECWVYLNEAASSAHRPHLITKYYSYGLAVDTGSVARMFFYTDEWDFTSSTTFIYPNRWYHLAATIDQNMVRLYVNGVEESNTVLNDALNQNFEDVRLGAVNDIPGNDNLNGMMDEVRIWDVTRTRTQIQDNMNRTIPGNTSGLVGYWRLDENDGTNADCETTYDNDGVLKNISTPSAWQTSTAPVGERSIFAESSNITETSACEVDVVFRSGSEGPGPGLSLAVMQVNELPNSVTGLYPDRAGQYWEIWSEDPDFDGNFTADVSFHYDDIIGLPPEPSLELFRRDNATGTWSPAIGYSVVSNDGGSSSTTDGIGYIELTITETTTGGFSGQYIISWTNAPVVGDIPDQSVPEGSAFATINLDDYVSDPDHNDTQISWTVTGEENVSITITGRVATITANDPEWNGNDRVTFTAEDPEGGTDSDDVTFEVSPVNDFPVVGDIPDQEVAEGAAFATINLDDYVTDVEDAVEDMIWTATGQTNLTVDITGRVATITSIDTNWNGSEIITFQAEDTEGGTDSDPVMFTVTPVNDPPVLDEIPDQLMNEGESFAPINLDDFVADVDDTDDLMTWAVSGASNFTVDITDRVATITIDDAEWNGSDTLVFTVKDTSGAMDMDTSIFTVTGINDPPTLNQAISDTITDANVFFIFVLDQHTFADVDPEDDLLLSASISQRGTPPAWLAFEAASGTFTGLPGDADSGVVEVIVTATDDSAASVSDTFSIRVISHVGVSNPLKDLEITLYPNPNHGMFIIESDRFELHDAVLEIFNEKGQLVWNREIREEAGTLHESVEMENAAAGLYMLKVRNKSGMINKRFVIGH